MAENVLIISDNNFETEVLQSDKPVLLDFWAPWCGPCKAIGPMIEDLAASFGDKVKFAKINVDENQVTASQYSIQSIPTLMFFKNGNIVDQIIGVVAKAKLEQAINNIVA